MKATPTAPLEMRKPDLLLEFLIIALDAPAQLREIDQAIEGDVVGERRKPVFGRLDLALRPFNQQPFRRPWISALIIAMGDANAHAGKARDQRLGRAFAHGLIIAIVIAALFSLVFLLAGPAIYAVMAGQGEILAAAVEYSNVIFAGAFAYWLLGALTSVVRATGQVAILAWVYVAAEVLHIALVPLLMFGWGPVPSFGIAGAGIATVTAFTASSAFLFAYLWRGKTPIRLSLGGVRLERRLFADILSTGVPLSLQPILNNIALAFLTGYAGSLGAAALAGVGAAVRLEYLMYPVVFGLGATLVAMVGTNVGAGQLARAVRITWIAAGMAVLATGSIGLAAIVCPQGWISLFTAAPEVSEPAALYLGIAALGYAFIGMNTLTSAFQAMGQTFWPLMGVLSRAAVLGIGGWLVVPVMGGGVIGLAIVTASGLAIGGSIVAVAFWLGMRRKLGGS